MSILFSDFDDLLDLEELEDFFDDFFIIREYDPSFVVKEMEASGGEDVRSIEEEAVDGLVIVRRTNVEMAKAMSIFLERIIVYLCWCLF